MDTGRKTVRVTIFNQSYTLVAADDPGEVETLAQSVDDLMTEISQRTGTMDSNRVAVLACLHMADRLRAIEKELGDLKARVDEKSRQFSMLLDSATNSHE